MCFIFEAFQQPKKLKKMVLIQPQRHRVHRDKMVVQEILTYHFKKNIFYLKISLVDEE